MADNSSVRGPCPPLLSLRLLVPPLRLVSAAILQTVEQKIRRDYGILDEFITMVTEIVPELLQVRERSLLSLGLRAQLVLELCRSEQPADLKTIQPHLKIVQTLTTLLSSTTEASYLLATLSKCNFVGFIETLLNDTEKKEHFYQDVYPKIFGSKYDEAIQILMGQFLKRLENLLPIPNLQQASSMLSCVPNPLEECMESVSSPEGLKTLLEYQKDLIQLDDDAHSIPSLEDNILSALCLSVNDHEVNGSGLPISTLTDHMYSSNQKLMVDSATLTAGEEDEGVVKEEIETEKQSVYITEAAQNSEVTHNAQQQQREFQSLPENIVVWESSLPEVQIGANSEVCDEGLECEEERLVKDVEVVYETDWLIGEDRKMEPLDNPMLNEESIEGVESSSAIDRFVKEESEEISCGPEFLGQVKSIIVTDALISSMLQKPRVKLKRLDPSVAFSFTTIKSFPNEAPKKMDSRKVSINSKRLTLKSCPVCGSTFSRVSDLRLHQKSHKVSALPRFSCSMCKKRFRYMYDLKIHKVNLCQENVPDPDPSPPLTSSPAKKRLRGPRECSVCEKTIRNHSYFVRHMKSHSEERPHRCLLCNKGYKGTHNLKLHSEKCTGHTSKSDHERDEEDDSAETPCSVIPGQDRLAKDLRNLDCKVCGKTFPYPSVLRRHIQRTHLGVSLFECSKCSEEFTIQSDLAKHQLDVCQGSVPQPDQKTSKKLKDKITIKSRKCGVCGKIFAKPSQLQYHMITHNDERPYKCTYCEKTFKYITNFRMHGEVCQPAGDKPREDVSVGRAPTVTDQNDAQSSSNSILLSNSKQNQLTLEEKMETHSEIPNDMNEPENVVSCQTALSPQDLENGPGQIEVCTHPADRNKDRKDAESAFGVTVSKPSRRSRGKKSTIETDDTSSEMCLICKLLVKGSMKCHLRSHSDMSPYSCPHCKVKFRFKNDLRKHMKGEHDHADAETLKKIERSLKCDECGKEFMFIRTLRQHKYTHNPLYCIECKRLFPSMAAFSTHRLMHKSRPCMICLENLNGLTQLNKHYLEVHEYRGPFACTSCERSYTDLKGLIIHERVHTGELPFKCPKCPKSFNYPFTLAIHIKTHTEEKPFLCWDCGKCYRNPGALRSHRLSFHGSDKDKRCICSHCGITFALKGNLNKHVAKEHAGVRYPCTYCGKLFLSASSLTRHDLIHTQERPYPCTECDKSFRSASELKIHTRYHTGERPFKCEQCGKGFTQSYHLTDHRRMHTGEKPYQCPTCERYFRSAKVLKKHKMTHTGEKPYKCSVCDMAYSRMNLLKTHVRKSH